MPTLIVVWPGTVSMSVRFLPASSCCSSFSQWMKSPAKWMALTPRWVIEECASTPVKGGDDATAGVLSVHNAHHGRLAHDHRPRPRHVAHQLFDQRRRAQAADLLVVAEGEMQGAP